MISFILLYIYIILTLELCPFLWGLIEYQLTYNPYFLYYLFIVLFLINYFFINRKENFNNNFDLLIKFFKFMSLSLIKFYNFFFIEIKKFLLYITQFKLFELITTFKTFILIKLNNLFIIWRPLFKKWSYFGYYRSNRSKWIK